MKKREHIEVEVPPKKVAPPQLPDSAHVVPFEILREAWSTYTLGPAQELVLRVRSVLLYLLEVPVPNEDQIPGSDARAVVPVAQTIISIHPPEKGDRSVSLPRSDYTPPTNAEIEAVARIPWPFVVVEQESNEYLMRPDHGPAYRLRTRVLLDGVERLGDLQDPLGLPLVSVESRLVTSQPSRGGETAATPQPE